MRHLDLVFSPANDLFGWSKDMERFFDNKTTRAAFAPAVDVEENETHYIVSLDVPGVNKEDIKIELNDRLLTISGEKKNYRQEKNKTFHLTERSTGRFERRFTLPENVDSEKVEAMHADGVLKVSIAKSETAKPKLIQISQ